MLGPVLFACYINDMPDTISSLIYMYADDTKMASVVNVKKTGRRSSKNSEDYRNGKRDGN